MISSGLLIPNIYKEHLVCSKEIKFTNDIILEIINRYTKEATIEVETIDDAPFGVKVELYTKGVYKGIDYMVDNSLGFSAVSGAELYINPKKRTNEQLNREAVINEVDGSQISAEWNGFNWLSDGWVDADGNAYDFAFGLNWSGVINDDRVKRYK